MLCLVCQASWSAFFFKVLEVLEQLLRQTDLLLDPSIKQLPTNTYAGQQQQQQRQQQGPRISQRAAAGRRQQPAGQTAVPSMGSLQRTAGDSYRRGSREQLF